MALAALVTWVLTAGGGFILLATWLGREGMKQRTGGRIKPPLILAHFVLAAAGLVLWIAYVATDEEAYAWIAFALLAIVALLGFTMFAIWAQQRQSRQPRPAPAAGEPAEPAEQHFPVPIVALHGLLAVLTVVLALLAVLEVGG
jgi:manganese efflux pump family protein